MFRSALCQLLWRCCSHGPNGDVCRPYRILRVCVLEVTAPSPYLNYAFMHNDVACQTQAETIRVIGHDFATGFPMLITQGLPASASSSFSTRCIDQRCVRWSSGTEARLEAIQENCFAAAPRRAMILNRDSDRWWLHAALHDEQFGCVALSYLEVAQPRSHYADTVIEQVRR